MSKLAVPILLGAVLLVGLLIFSQSRQEPSKVSGFIEADEIRVGSRVGGRVQKVDVEEGDSVDAGKLLVELEPFNLKEKQAEAKAQLAAREAELEKLQAGFRDEEIAQAAARVEQTAARRDMLFKGPREQEIEAGKARKDLAQAQLDRAKKNFDRIEELFGKGAVTKDEFDAANEELRVTEAQLRVRAEELDLLEAGTREEEKRQVVAQLKEAEQALKLNKNGFRAEDIAEAKAAVAAARAALASIDRQIAELKITAPVASVVEAVELQPGDLIAPNAPVLSLMDTSHLWVRAYVPEDQLDLQIGQHVPLSVDSFPGRRFRGRVTFISRQAEFTPSNVQTPEDRSKQVFRIKVELEEGLDVLRAGMAADVWLGEKVEAKK